MIILLFFFVHAISAISNIIGAHLCSSELKIQQIRDTNANALLILDNSGSTNTDLFIAARMVKTNEISRQAVVVADCISKRIGVTFHTFLVAMPCGVKEISRIMSEIDAVNTDDAFTFKLQRVLQYLDQWNDTRNCAVWGTEQSRAATFWVLMGLVIYACVGCLKRRSLQH